MPTFITFNNCQKIDLCFDSNQSFYNQIQELAGTINENALIDADIVPSATQVNFKIFILNYLGSKKICTVRSVLKSKFFTKKYK
jgi:hypothetical protein